MIELLVVLVIIGVVTGIGFAAYREFSQRQQIVEAVKLVKSDLLLTQQRALSGEKPSGCSGILNGWKVSFSSVSYDIVADCGVLGAGGDVLIKTVNLPANIRKTAGAASVTFKVLAKGTTETGDVSFTFTQSGTNRTGTITVTTTGRIF